MPGHRGDDDLGLYGDGRLVGDDTVELEIAPGRHGPLGQGGDRGDQVADRSRPPTRRPTASPTPSEPGQQHHDPMRAGHTGLERCAPPRRDPHRGEMTPVAAPSGSLPIGRYLGALAGILVVLYALVFFTGDSPTPKLGLDLEGGTQVTLQAQTDRTQAAQQRRARPGPADHRAPGQRPRCRRGRGGHPGPGPDRHLGARRERRRGQVVGQTAQLRLRPVIYRRPPPRPPPPAATPLGRQRPGRRSRRVRVRVGQAVRVGHRRRASRRPRRRRDAGRDRPGRHRAGRAPRRPPPARPRPRRPASTRSSTRRPLAEFDKLTCAPNAGASASLDKPTDVIASCDQNGGTQVPAGARDHRGHRDRRRQRGRADLDQPAVDGLARLQEQAARRPGPATPPAQRHRHARTTRPTTSRSCSTARRSRPRPSRATINGQTQITGSFTQAQATDLANVLKYGALPLTFSSRQRAVDLRRARHRPAQGRPARRRASASRWSSSTRCSTTARSAW